MLVNMEDEMKETSVTTNRDKWIGGSDLPSILGTNRGFGKSIIEFAKQKLNIIPNNFSGNQFTKYGDLMEDSVRQYINAQYGFNFIVDNAVDPIRMYRGNCDGIDREQKVLFECKTFSGKLKVDYYTPQCQFYMELFDIDECWLVGYNRPDNFYTGLSYELENDNVFFNTEFDESRVVIYKLTRDKAYFNKIEIEINKFKYLLEALKEDEILNGK